MSELGPTVCSRTTVVPSRTNLKVREACTHQRPERMARSNAQTCRISYKNGLSLVWNSEFSDVRDIRVPGLPQTLVAFQPPRELSVPCSPFRSSLSGDLTGQDLGCDESTGLHLSFTPACLSCPTERPYLKNQFLIKLPCRVLTLLSVRLTMAWTPQMRPGGHGRHDDTSVTPGDDEKVPVGQGLHVTESDNER